MGHFLGHVVVASHAVVVFCVSALFVCVRMTAVWMCCLDMSAVWAWWLVHVGFHCCCCCSWLLLLLLLARYDMAAKIAPEVTLETTATLEDIIRQRIRDEAW